jgi:hypothetical protein
MMFSLHASCDPAEALAGGAAVEMLEESVPPLFLPDVQLASNTMQTVPRIRNEEARFAFIVFFFIK